MLLYWQLRLNMFLFRNTSWSKLRFGSTSLSCNYVTAGCCSKRSSNRSQALFRLVATSVMSLCLGWLSSFSQGMACNCVVPKKKATMLLILPSRRETVGASWVHVERPNSDCVQSISHALTSPAVLLLSYWSFCNEPTSGDCIAWLTSTTLTGASLYI